MAKRGPRKRATFCEIQISESAKSRSPSASSRYRNSIAFSKNSLDNRRLHIGPRRQSDGGEFIRREGRTLPGPLYERNEGCYERDGGENAAGTLFDRFDLPLRIPEALPNNKHVEPNHGTSGKRDHVVHSSFLCAKRINHAHKPAYRDLALAGQKLRCHFKLSAQETHTSWQSPRSRSPALAPKCSYESRDNPR